MIISSKTFSQLISKNLIFRLPKINQQSPSILQNLIKDQLNININIIVIYENLIEVTGRICAVGLPHFFLIRTCVAQQKLFFASCDDDSFYRQKSSTSTDRGRSKIDQARSCVVNNT